MGTQIEESVIQSAIVGVTRCFKNQKKILKKWPPPPPPQTQQQKWMVVDPVNQYQKLYLQLYELLMMGVNTRNM